MKHITEFLMSCTGSDAALDAGDAALESRNTTQAFPSVDRLPVQSGMPDPFAKSDGSRITTTKQWQEQRRYLKSMVAHYVYGTMPPRPMDFGLKRVMSKSAFNDLAVNERYAVDLERNGKRLTLHFEFFRPVEAVRHPTIIKNCGRLFDPNEADTPNRRNDVVWDLKAAEEAVARGYLLCKFRRTDVTPDDHGGPRKKQGILALYPEYDWAIIAAWAWAHGVVADALNRLELSDMDKIVATGHSRGGKTALCAGIFDERISITAPNSSGGGGTASLRYFKESEKERVGSKLMHQTLGYLQDSVPNWFSPRWFQFVGKIERMPFDSHTMKALIAPRALVNQCGLQDYWTNPHGTELTYRAADKVFEWLGAKGQQGIHWREGKHAMNTEDWTALLDFADWKFFGKEPVRSFSALNHPNVKLPVYWTVPPTDQESRTEDYH